MTDTEIKKALECCVPSNRECADCPFYDNGNGEFACIDYLQMKALDLINRLQFRIHQQEKTIMEIQNANLIDFKATIGNYKAENESLKAEVERLKIAQFQFISDINAYKEKLKNAKAEAYKEFATKTTDKVEKVKQKYERLCKEQGEKMEEHMHIHFNGIIKIVKDLLKEVGVDGKEGET